MAATSELPRNADHPVRRGVSTFYAMRQGSKVAHIRPILRMEHAERHARMCCRELKACYTALLTAYGNHHNRFDKFAFVQNLEKRGFTRAQAEGIADTVTDIALAQLVSKTDLRDALAHLKIDLLKFMFSAMAAQTALIVALIQLLR